MKEDHLAQDFSLREGVQMGAKRSVDNSGGLPRHSPPSNGADPVEAVRANWSRRRSSSVPNLRVFNKADDKLKSRKQFWKEYKINNYNHSESLYSVISVLYAVFIIVMGASLPVAELFANQSNILTDEFEGFYVYLFSASIAFLLFVQMFIIQNETNFVTRVIRKIGRRVKEHSDSAPTHERSGNKAMSINSHAHTGSFFLRLGAVGYGIGGMILEGLHFGEFLATDLHLRCTTVIEVIRPLLQMTFILAQTYFIFRNSKMVIHKHRVIARFGMMHMVATNLCVWLRVIAIETMHELHHLHHDSDHHGSDHHGSSHDDHQSAISSSSHDDHHYDNYISHSNDSHRHHRAVHHDDHDHDVIVVNGSHGIMDHAVHDCGHGESIMTAALNNVSNYLFACTVEYSLITAGVMYLMWCNIKHRPATESSHHHKSSGEKGHHPHPQEKEGGRSKPIQRIRLDWTGANRGLFFGFFVLTLSIISMIVFFNLSNRDEEHLMKTAVILMLATILSIHIVSSIAVFGAAVRFRDLSFHKDLPNNLDQILLLVALVGVYLFNIFLSIAGTYRPSTTVGGLSLVSSIVDLFQATIQTLFILNGLRRSLGSQEQETTKPGRQYVTFLVVTNTALWAIDSFEVLHAGSHPVAMGFYGQVPWSIITHVTVPLAIFYRYHSTVCLADIWKDAYKPHHAGHH